MPRITTAPALQDGSHVCHFPTSVAQVTAVMECIDVAGLHRWPEPMGEACGVRVCKLARRVRSLKPAWLQDGRACHEWRSRLRVRVRLCMWRCLDVAWRRCTAARMKCMLTIQYNENPRVSPKAVLLLTQTDALF